MEHGTSNDSILIYSSVFFFFCLFLVGLIDLILVNCVVWLIILKKSIN